MIKLLTIYFKNIFFEMLVGNSKKVSYITGTHWNSYTNKSHITLLTGKPDIKLN